MTASAYHLHGGKGDLTFNNVTKKNITGFGYLPSRILLYQEPWRKIKKYILRTLRSPLGNNVDVRIFKEEKLGTLPF